MITKTRIKTIILLSVLTTSAMHASLVLAGNNKEQCISRQLQIALYVKEDYTKVVYDEVKRVTFKTCGNKAQSTLRQRIDRCIKRLDKEIKTRSLYCADHLVEISPIVSINYWYPEYNDLAKKHKNAGFDWVILR